MKKLFAFFILFLGFTCIYAQTPYRKNDLGYGKWSQTWFADEFGDPMYDKPYIQTELKDLSNRYYPTFYYIRYVKYQGHNVFETYIGDKQGNEHLYEGEATVKIKNSAGQVSTIKVKVSGNGAIMYMGDAASTLARLINSGNFSISIAAHSVWDNAGKPHTWVFHCTNETKDFYKAVQAGLKTRF